MSKGKSLPSSHNLRDMLIISVTVGVTGVSFADVDRNQVVETTSVWTPQKNDDSCSQSLPDQENSEQDNVRYEKIWGRRHRDRPEGL